MMNCLLFVINCLLHTRAVWRPSVRGISDIRRRLSLDVVGVRELTQPYCRAHARVYGSACQLIVLPS